MPSSCVNHRRLLRPDARNARQRQHAGAARRLQLLEHRQRAGGEQRDDLVGQVLADAWMSVSDRDSSSAIAASGSGRSPILRAPLRYARTRNGLAP